MAERRLSVWLDDERPMPDHFNCHCKTAEEATEALKTGDVVSISLDHDLGSGRLTGYDVAVFIEKSAYDGTLGRMRLAVYSANPVGKQNIKMALRNAYSYWLNNRSTTEQ